ncbi:unnamed protein product, partial [marine sediment metagenome]
GDLREELAQALPWPEFLYHGDYPWLPFSHPSSRYVGPAPSLIYKSTAAKPHLLPGEASSLDAGACLLYKSARPHLLA